MEQRGIVVIDTKDPHRHPDAMGRVGKSPHAQALTRNRVACTIPIEPEALFDIAYEVAYVEQDRGDRSTSFCHKGMHFLAEVCGHVQAMAVDHLRPSTVEPEQDTAAGD